MMGLVWRGSVVEDSFMVRILKLNNKKNMMIAMKKSKCLREIDLIFAGVD